MVSSVAEVAEFVREAIAQSEARQSTEMARRLSDQKDEITRDAEQVRIAMTQGYKEYATAADGELSTRLEGALQAFVTNTNAGTQTPIKDAAEQTRKEKQDLEVRLEAGMRELNTALIKMAEAELGVLPSLEPRLNKMQSEIAELEANRKSIVLKMKEISSASESGGPKESKPEPEGASAASTMGGMTQPELQVPPGVTLHDMSPQTTRSEVRRVGKE